MKDGYAKEIYEEHNNTLFNVVAVSDIVKKYNFRNTYHCTYTLERAFTTIIILYEDPEKIEVCIYYKIEIDFNKKGLFLELMSLNEKYGLNLGFRVIDKRVCANYTIYCRPHRISAESFTSVFERHINNIDAHEDEIINTISRFAVSFVDEEIPPFNVEDFARYLERRQVKNNCGQSIREYENDIFNLRELDPNNLYDDEDDDYYFEDDEEDE